MLDTIVFRIAPGTKAISTCGSDSEKSAAGQTDVIRGKLRQIMLSKANWLSWFSGA